MNAATLRLVTQPAASGAPHEVAPAATWHDDREELLQEVKRAHHEALFRLASAAHMKEGDNGMRPLRMGYLSEALALLLGLTPSQARMLRLAAPLHDVGKIGVAETLINKPGPLDVPERRQVAQHAQMGADMLRRAQLPLCQLAAELALTHHERWDGCGYPMGLAGEDIPLAGRIVAVVDSFDALTSERSHRKAFSDDVALGMLSQQRGKAFDPRVVGIFLAHSPEMLALRDRINRNRPGFQDLVALH
jgi:putative two-component system response regulator